MIRKIPPPCMMTQGMISGVSGDTPEIPDNGEKVIYTSVMTRRVVCVCVIHGPGARLRWKPRKKTTLEQGATTVRYKREYYYECEEEDEAIKVVLLYQKTT